MDWAHLHKELIHTVGKRWYTFYVQDTDGWRYQITINYSLGDPGYAVKRGYYVELELVAVELEGENVTFRSKTMYPRTRHTRHIYDAAKFNKTRLRYVAENVFWEPDEVLGFTEMWENR